MRILYLSLSYVPSRSASSVHVMKMCAALAEHGHQVELVTKLAPQRLEPGVHDDHAFYGVEPSFTLTKLERPGRRGGGLLFARAQLRKLAQQPAPDLVYSRDLVGAWLACRRGLPVLFEAHGLPTGWLAKLLVRRILGYPSLARIVFISQALQDKWHQRGLCCPDTVVAHDAADPLPVEQSASSGETTPLKAGYVGHLYAGRGIELIVSVAKRLPAIEFHLVGGREKDLAAWRAQSVPANVIFHGFIAPARLPELYRSFDLLLMPYQHQVGVRSGRSDTASWMSPMKMFEYMAAGRPIVSSNLPVLREVLTDDRNALLAEPGAIDDWVAAVDGLANDRELRQRLAATAVADFDAHYTWTARAAAVLDGLTVGSR